MRGFLYLRIEYFKGQLCAIEYGWIQRIIFENEEGIKKLCVLCYLRMLLYFVQGMM